MDVLLRVAGALLLAVAVADIFFTVLFPASRHGPLRKPLTAAVWRTFHLIAGATRGERRRAILSYSGPVVISVTMAAWFVLLVLGWAMIFKPALGEEIVFASGERETGWATALYFSGFSVTTLGMGDVRPATDVYRLLVVAEAALGFSFFSMAITYFLSVYSGLTGRNAFAQGLHDLSGGTGNAADLLTRLAEAGEMSDVKEFLSEKATFLREARQTHRFYPVLRYFHYRQPQYAMPRVLLIALETGTLIQSVLDEEEHGWLTRSPRLDELSSASMALVHELVAEEEPAPPEEGEVERWRQRYATAAAQLAAAGLCVRREEEGAARYVELRARWDAPLRRLSHAMLCEWDTVCAAEGAPDGRGGRGGRAIVTAR